MKGTGDGALFRCGCSTEAAAMRRETGDITIAQAPNLVLWVVIVAGVLRWVWQPPGIAAIALDIVFKGGLIVWALDEIFRGMNPWRRCLGGAVLAYELTTFL
jgi:hypothetical protein